MIPFERRKTVKLFVNLLISFRALFFSIAVRAITLFIYSFIKFIYIYIFFKKKKKKKKKTRAHLRKYLLNHFVFQY